MQKSGLLLFVLIVPDLVMAANSCSHLSSVRSKRHLIFLFFQCILILLVLAGIELIFFPVAAVFCI